MNAGNEGVEKEHEDHHTEDGNTLYQQNLVRYSVLWRRKYSFLNEEKADFIICLTVIVLREVSKTRPASLLR